MKRKKIILASFFGLITTSIVIMLAYLELLSDRVEEKLDGILWTVPAKVYSRPLEIAEGYSVKPQYIQKELELLSYSKKRNPEGPGEFHFEKGRLDIYLRGYEDQKPGLFKVFF